MIEDELENEPIMSKKTKNQPKDHSELTIKYIGNLEEVLKLNNIIKITSTQINEHYYRVNVWAKDPIKGPRIPHSYFVCCDGVNFRVC